MNARMVALSQVTTELFSIPNFAIISLSAALKHISESIDGNQKKLGILRERNGENSIVLEPKPF